MASELSPDEVIVTLAAVDDTTKLSYPRRRLLLSKSKPTAPIGRASKRNKDLEPRMYNGWIDAPVMSRDHAELSLDTQNNIVSIKDVGSLHGTYLNGDQLRGTQARPLNEGDVIKFGISINRAHDKFPQCVMQVGLTYSSREEIILSNTFQVPDESEIEAEAVGEVDEADEYFGISDDDGLADGLLALQENGIRPKIVSGCMTSDPIDLTSEPDINSSWGGDLDSASESTSESSEGLLEPLYEDTTFVQEGDCDTPQEKELSKNFAPAAQCSRICAEKQYASAVADKEAAQASRSPAGESEDSLHVTSEAVDFLTSIIERPRSSRKVEILGESIGTAEYFKAREQNKVLAQRLETVDVDASGLPTSEPVPLQTLSNDGDDGEQVKLATAQGLGEVPDTMEFDSFLLPELDENNDKLVPETSLVTPSLKRKLGEISDLLPEERTETNLVDNDNIELQDRRSPAELVAADQSRAARGFRRVAEVFGYAALGGAAVMSALIATAPNL